jgi:hypothetical protein
MAEAALSVIAGPVISSVLQDVLGTQGGGATGSGAGGLFSGLLNNFTSAFQGLFGGNSNSTHFPDSGVTPYSTANMSSMALNDPMSQLQPAMGRFNEFNNSIVRDHRHPVSSEGGTVVRDHRYHEGAIIASSGNTIGDIKDAGEDAALNSAQAAADQAEQKMEADPTNVANQLDYEKKQQALQNLFTTLQDQAKEKAQMQKEAAQASLLN